MIDITSDLESGRLALLAETAGHLRQKRRHQRLAVAFALLGAVAAAWPLWKHIVLD